MKPSSSEVVPRCRRSADSPESGPRGKDPSQTQTQSAPPRRTTWPRGLPNLGNSCFLNACIQAVRACSALSAHLDPHICPSLLEDEEACTDALQSLASKLGYTGQEQEDAHECFTRWVDLLSTDPENLSHAALSQYFQGASRDEVCCGSCQRSRIPDPTPFFHPIKLDMPGTATKPVSSPWRSFSRNFKLASLSSSHARNVRRSLRPKP